MKLPLLFVLTFFGSVLPALGADSEKMVPARSSRGSGGKAGTFANETIKVDKIEREYRLVVPKSVDPKKPAPLLFAFHGFLIDSKDLMPVYTQLDKLAEDKGFILVYPNGKNHAWVLVPQLAKNDIAFFDALYEHLTSKYNIDLNRVYLAGMSNGGYFTHLVASQKSDKVAAICSHSAGLGALAFGEPKVKHKYAVFIAHGDEDSIVKVEEGRKTRDAYEKWGHPVKYIEIPKHNHFWGTNEGINKKMWD